MLDSLDLVDHAPTPARRIALTGCHSTGKSTLAKMLAEKMGLRFIESPSTKAHQILGLKVGPLSFQDRVRVQEMILAIYLNETTFDDNFISDRSPVDFIVYTMIGTTLPENPEDRAQAEAYLADYIHRCRQALDGFTNIVVLHPALAYEDRDYRWSKSSFTDQVYTSLALGELTFMTTEWTMSRFKPEWCSLPKPMTDLEERCRFVIEQIATKEGAKQDA